MCLTITTSFVTKGAVFATFLVYWQLIVLGEVNYHIAGLGHQLCGIQTADPCGDTSNSKKVEKDTIKFYFMKYC